MTTIQTKRLSLTRIEANDKHSLVALIGDLEVSRFLSYVPHPYTEADADWWIQSVQNLPYSLNVFAAGQLVGGAGLTDQGEGKYELGYWFGKPFWGLGYATEACVGLLGHVKKQLGDAQVFANVYPNNLASEAVLHKLGFAKTGVATVVNVSTKEEIVANSFGARLSQLECS